MNKPVTPLATAAVGETLTVQSIRGGKMRSTRLTALGILPGSELELISKSQGPVVVDVRGSRLAIGQTLALSIMV